MCIRDSTNSIEFSEYFSSMDFKASLISFDVGGLLKSKADNISFSLRGLEEEKSKASMIRDKLSML